MKKVLTIMLPLAILLMAVAPMAVMASQETQVNLSAVASTYQRSMGNSPDLTLSFVDISFSQIEPMLGEEVIITAIVHNVGDTRAWNVLVGFYDGEPDAGVLIGNDRIRLVLDGKSRSADVKWVPEVEGDHDIYVQVDPDDTISEDNEDNNQAFKTVTVFGAAPPPPPPPPPAIEYEFFIEIDYMQGHEPTRLVLEYIHDYYYERGIDVTFYADIWDYDDEGNFVLFIDALYSDMVPFDASTTDQEFWDFEEAYNDNDHGYYSKWKWVLFGAVDGEYGSLGYTWVVLQGRIKLDGLAGNYIFIADETADNWALSKGIKPYGAEAVVLMHELGHSIGIGDFHRFRGEVYCDDAYCVMALLSVYNARNHEAWYYCDDHWATKNLEYYAI
jgi:hypothetical protein